MFNLICVRHGQSLWNKENKFTGWVDIDLSEQGIKEAKAAGTLLKNYKFDKVFTSVLMRAYKTAEIILDEINQSNIEIIKNKALNERHYGDLQGKNKEEVGNEFGAEQLHIWRRSYSTPPPRGESLRETKERVIKFFNEHILPLIKQGNSILIAAHGNSLRALAMYLENISEDDISELNIPTGIPYLYILDKDLKLIEKKYLNE